jgi:hypothetical protein
MELFSSSSVQIEQVQCLRTPPRQNQNLPAMNVSINIVARVRGTVAVKR